VEIECPSYERDTGMPAIPRWQPPPRERRFSLLMISPKSRYYTHSQSNLPPLRGRRPQVLLMNPQDAMQRGIAEGDAVRMYNDRGEGISKAHLSREIMPGVVSLPEGIWMALDAEGVDHAGSANLFTSTLGTAAAKANIMHGMEIEVVRAESGEPPQA
jgi:anaerobic dimethyl sulfoxide reductase subunit A